MIAACHIYFRWVNSNEFATPPLLQVAFDRFSHFCQASSRDNDQDTYTQITYRKTTLLRVAMDDYKNKLLQ